MRILYDHQAFTIQRYGGISRYFFHLMSAIKDVPDTHYHLSLKYSNNDYLSLLKNDRKRFLPNLDFKGKYQIMRRMNNLITIGDLQKQTFDLFHPTYYDTYFLKVLAERKPFVITIYDLIHERFGNAIPQLNVEKDALKNKSELLAKAKRVIAISNSTKKDLIEIYNVDPGKIDVVHLASSFCSSDEEIKYEKSGYLLFVGNRGLYKNFTFFLEVVSQYLLKHNLQLVCAGGPSFSNEELTLIKRLGVNENVRHQYIVNDEDLIMLYRNALSFIFPSLYEGFGIPVLEALQLGCPSIISNTSSFPEVGGDAVVYFDPYDKESLSQALSDVITNESLRRSLINRGLQQNKKFSWSKCVNETISSYRGAA